MPAKKKCQAQTLVSTPALPLSITNDTNGNKELPATDAKTETVRCNQPAQRIVGDCGFCLGGFCAGHRLPEQHGCAKLQACKDAAYALNKAKLEAERTVPSKVAFA